MHMSVGVHWQVWACIHTTSCHCMVNHSLSLSLSLSSLSLSLLHTCSSGGIKVLSRVRRTQLDGRNLPNTRGVWPSAAATAPDQSLTYSMHRGQAEYEDQEDCSQTGRRKAANPERGACHTHNPGSHCRENQGRRKQRRSQAALDCRPLHGSRRLVSRVSPCPCKQTGSRGHELTVHWG